MDTDKKISMLTAGLVFCFAISCLCLVAAPTNAVAEEEGEPPTNVYLLVVPDLTWDSINTDYTPNLYHVAKNHACTNVITESKVDIEDLETHSGFHYQRLDNARTSDVDARVKEIYDMLESSDSLVVTSSPSLAKGGSYELPGYGMAIVIDRGDKGLLTSTTVRRSGLITSGNLGDAIYSLLASPQIKPGNLSVYPFSGTLSAADRINQLIRENSIAMSVRYSEVTFIAVFLVVMILTFILSAFLLFAETRTKPALLEHLLPSSRILWVVALAIPVATYLMFVQLPTYTTPEIVSDYFLFTMIEIAFTCIIIALVFKWSYALLFVLGLTVLTLTIDQLIGGPMTATGYLSYAPIEVTRYYGIGNEGASFAFGSWIMFSAILLNCHISEKFNYHFKTWIFPLGTIVLFMIIGAPWWGANFGVIIWGTVGASVAWTMFNGHSFSFKRTLLLTLLASVLAFLMLILDILTNPESHLSTYASWIAQGNILMIIPDVFSHVLPLSVKTLVFSPPLTIAFFAILVFMVFLLVKKPGSYTAFWENNHYFKSGYAALLVAACIALITEDSGIFMPALLLLYAFAGLLWLVCDNYGLHIRKWITGKFVDDVQPSAVTTTRMMGEIDGDEGNLQLY